MHRTTRIILIAIGAILGLLLLTGGAGFLWLRTSLPKLAGTIELAGLSAPVEVRRDRNGVPRIAATRTEDAYFALGYVHAQDRLWQMESMRRLGAGRLSELFGNRTLRIDRYIRTFGLYRLAEAQAADSEGAERAALDAYAKGVNAYIDGHGGALPPEFVLLNHRPEPWRAADSLVWARIMALRLSRNWRSELLRLRLADRLTTAQIEELWPDEGADTPLTLTESMRSAALPLRRLWQALPQELAPVDASNAWVLDGTRTASGKPILANDPHLGFSVPILWYLVQIKAPGLALTGATVPGVPLLILGHNSHIAWGMTTTGGDVEDLFVERIDPSNPARYLTPSGAAPFEKRTETIRVKGEEPISLTVRSTRHGPVISDIIENAKSAIAPTHVLALASSVLRRDDKTPRALFMMNRARNWSDFIAATQSFHSPQQNLFYADTAGDIGMIAPGRIPLRRAGDGRLPVSGEGDRYDWQGFVAADAVPRAHNPGTGAIVNANNTLVGSEYPYLITRDWDKGYRAARLNEVLRRQTGLTVADAAALQMDTLSTAARRLVPLLLAARPGTPRAEAARKRLRKWDYRMRRDRPEPLIYAAWLRHLMRVIAADELGDLFEDYGRVRPGFITSVLTEKRHWCDNIATGRTENCREQLAHALEQALLELSERHGSNMSDWRWGAAHYGVFAHRLFTHVPILNRLADRIIPTDGGDNTVNRGQTSPHRDNPFAHTHGSGFRAVYDLADLDRSRFMIATGQSGNPLSPHYDDLLDRWRAGGALPLPAKEDSVVGQTDRVLMLVPAPAP